MRQATTQALYQYWNTVRGSRLAPRRFEIEPSQISSYLSETIILEDPGSDACRIRVVGTSVCEWLGDGLRGQLFLEQWTSKDNPVLADGLRSLAKYGAVGLYTFDGELVTDGPVARFEMILLPLTHLEDRVERVLGSISLISAPAWLAAASPYKLQLQSSELIWPDGRPHRPAGDLMRFGSREVPVLRRDSGIRRARLVRSDRRSFLVYDGGLADSDDV